MGRILSQTAMKLDYIEAQLRRIEAMSLPEIERALAKLNRMTTTEEDIAGILPGLAPWAKTRPSRREYKSTRGIDPIHPQHPATRQQLYRIEYELQELRKG